MKKIIVIDNLIKEISKIKYKNKKIGMCHGVFDLLHLGHIRHFHEAKKICDILIVSVTADNFVIKGPGRPKFNQNERMEALSALQIVDFVVISNFASAEKNIQEIKPSYYFKGTDYKKNSDDITGKIKKEIKILKSFGGKIIYTNSKKYSSTSILNDYYHADKSKDVLRYYVQKKFSIIEIKKLLNNLSTVRPLVVGEVIIDEYNFCEALGKSGKEPMLVVRDLSREQYLGGSGAICNHLSDFSNKVTLLSYLGENADHLSFINKKLKKNVKFDYIKKNNSTTILKKRFIDNLVKSKILGLYSLNDSPLNSLEEKKLTEKFVKLNNKNDMIVISDYGHGLISKRFTKKIKKISKFVAVNSQINAANIGHHSLDNYSNVDLMIINEKEIRHQLRSRDKEISTLMKKLSKDMKINFLVVTRGSSGCVLLDRKKSKFYYSKAYSSNIVDKVGAGDALLSILAICIFKKIDLNLSLLISSLCAAQIVSTMGNKMSISKTQLIKDLEHYLA